MPDSNLMYRVYRPLLQREEASISSMKGIVQAHTDKYIFMLVGKTRRPEPKPYYIIERFPHYLGIIDRFASKEDASRAWKSKYVLYGQPTEQEDSQKA